MASKGSHAVHTCTCLYIHVDGKILDVIGTKIARTFSIKVVEPCLYLVLWRPAAMLAVPKAQKASQTFETSENRNFFVSHEQLLRINPHRYYEQAMG